jgi:hypothetical protein
VELVGQASIATEKLHANTHETYGLGDTGHGDEAPRDTLKLRPGVTLPVDAGAVKGHHQAGDEHTPRSFAQLSVALSVNRASP